MTVTSRTVTELKDFRDPDEIRPFEKGCLELVTISSGVVGRLILEPGWRWSDHVKPLAGTEWCEASHFRYHVSGTLHVKMADGTELDEGPGQITSLSANHDAWVVGDEPLGIVDFFGASHYAEGVA